MRPHLRDCYGSQTAFNRIGGQRLADKCIIRVNCFCIAGSFNSETSAYAKPSIQSWCRISSTVHTCPARAIANARPSIWLFVISIGCAERRRSSRAICLASSRAFAILIVVDKLPAKLVGKGAGRSAFLKGFAGNVASDFCNVRANKAPNVQGWILCDALAYDYVTEKLLEVARQYLGFSGHRTGSRLIAPERK